MIVIFFWTISSCGTELERDSALTFQRAFRLFRALKAMRGPGGMRCTTLHRIHARPAGGRSSTEMPGDPPVRGLEFTRVADALLTGEAEGAQSH